MALHGTGKTLALGGADNVNHLTSDKVLDRKAGADGQDRVITDPEFHQLALGLDASFGELATL
jgi:hypothetical protein